ncbi:methyl-accepting chemotaxis protein [Motiliproteus coralliicola]|uniref:Methyl-accepting chemotaxis protein n=2 Tax=Motiliproteus coralliicola TaxID=2283196 RepID=A0A369WCH6_9GAMM|nr:methyl-accepting chemotaxis protein [Motiliproteus coralliicola]
MQLLRTLSLKSKILANSILLLLLLCLCVGYSLITMSSIGKELEGIAELDVPLTEKLTAVSEHQLQQAVHFERVLRYFEQAQAGTGSGDRIDKELSYIDKLGAKVKQELSEAEQLANLAVRQAHSAEELSEFKQVLASIGEISGGYAQFTSQMQRAIGLFKDNKPEQMLAVVDQMVQQEEALVHQLEELVHEIGQFTEHAAREALAHEQSALTTLISIAVGSILLGIILSLVIVRDIWREIGHEPRALNQIAQSIADGDLTMEAPDKANALGVYGALGTMLINLKTLIEGIQVGGEHVASSSQELAAVTEQTNQNLSSQHQSTDQVATAITEMSSAVEEVARNTTDAADAANEATNQVSQSSALVGQTVEGVQSLAQQLQDTMSVIGDLEQGATEISSILDVIKGIADQTNLLALNAAIEAARAGEQGRGFAVVADEVRSLAKSTQESAAEIENMIVRVQASANQSVGAMRQGTEQAEQVLVQSEQVTAALDQVQSAVGAISDMNTQIASAAEEQKAVAEDVSRNINEIATMAMENGEGSKQLTATSEELSQLAQQLQSQIRQFRLQAS